MYLRFKTSFGDGWRSYGVFQAAHYLLREADICPYDEARLNELWQWFSDNLAAPGIYASKHPERRAICWFKPAATEHLRKMHEMKMILEEYGIDVRLVKSKAPGYVVYEDNEQIAVVPFREILKSTR